MHLFKQESKVEMGWEYRNKLDVKKAATDIRKNACS